jgi:excisionase family DNA binding protein
MEKLWTTREVAQVLGITEQDVEQLVKAGRLTGYQLGGQFLRFRPDEVTALKGTIAFRRQVGPARDPHQMTPLGRLREFLYFHDFYVVSGTLLALLVIYLMVSD